MRGISIVLFGWLLIFQGSPALGQSAKLIETAKKRGQVKEIRKNQDRFRCVDRSRAQSAPDKNRSCRLRRVFDSCKMRDPDIGRT